MAHFAQLDENKKVINIIVVANEDCLDENGNESEAVGVAFCKKLLGEDTVWLQTSINHKIRWRYASIGGFYLEEYDAFLSPQPYASWTLNMETLQWDPPVPEPQDGKIYTWSETEQKWNEYDKGNP